ncbi:immunoglobulin domain-containing protein [Methanothrix harundinacea]|uniref:Peptidase S8 and S53 subtilisin kexin sedolisin n=1 Tax=Methanothrix harundinacea (strain 6Ac) TaxID=1110509 RepID=G7WN37_METH6|nr:immunoglobulin domain-containing protein [Methanothrix harundinacea]AET63893.1 Peptidase S8 and S53 subtilisin kexin sedolisin [Methanothrix harundinacea 6Ac]
MKAIKLSMAVLIIGLFLASPSLGVASSPFGEGWPLWNDGVGIGDSQVKGISKADETTYQENASTADVLKDAPLAEEASADAESSEGYDAVVDDWIIDESFYSDSSGYEGEEFGWGDTIDHPGMPGPDENALWIVFPYSTNVRTTKLVIQRGRFAKELIIPGMDGKLTIHEVRPDGTEDTYVPDWQVKARRAYRVWFTADSVGDYTVWYEVQNPKTMVTTKSNEIKYRVFENLAIVVPNEVKCEGETATLRALVSGCYDPIYQWFKGITSEDGTSIPGATGSVYIIRNVSPEDEGYYTCKVTCNGNSDEDAGYLRVCTRDEEGNKCKGR